MRVIDGPDSFRLAIEFNRAECEAMYTVARNIGGPMDSDRDGHSVFEKLIVILREAGIRNEIALDTEGGRKGAIYFAKRCG